MCDFILTRGARKNLACGRKICDENLGKCRTHWASENRNEKHCTFVLTRGQRKGKECGKKLKTDNFCYAHSKDIEYTHCDVIISRGARKGMPCGRRCSKSETQCSTHLKKPKHTKNTKTPVLPTIDTEEQKDDVFKLPEVWLTNEIPEFELEQAVLKTNKEIILSVNCPGSLKTNIKGRRNITEDGAYVDFRDGKFYYHSVSGEISLGEIAFAYYYIYQKCHAKRSVIRIDQFTFDAVSTTITDNGSTLKDNKKF